MKQLSTGAVKPLLVVVLTALLYGIGLFSAEIPDGRALFFPGRAFLLYSASAAAMLGSVYLLLAALYVRMGIGEPRRVALHDLAPALLLALPAVRIWLLHAGLNIPQIATTLITPLVCCGGFAILLGGNMGSRLWPIVSQRITGGWLFRGASRDAGWIALVFCVSFSAYTLLIKDEDRRNMIVGDEPSYLIIMESLKQYGTADVRRLYQDKPALGDGVRLMGDPHVTETSRPGTMYSVHHIGLSLLLIIPHMVFGFHGVMLFLAAITSLTLGNIYLLCRHVSPNKSLCAALALLLGFTAPFSSYFRVIYPEPVAALFALYGFRVWLLEKNASRTSLVAGSLALAYLPWLHVKFLFLVLPIALLLGFFRILPVLRKTGAVQTTGRIWEYLPFAAWAVSGGLMMVFFQQAFGNWQPDAQYQKGEGLHLTFVVRGILGQLVDRDYGLLAVAPVYFLALPGLWLLARRNARLFAGILLLCTTYLAGTAGHWMWWGGPCPPARFIMPALALFSPCILLALESNKSRLFQSSAAFFILIGLIASAYGFTKPEEITKAANDLYFSIPGLEAFPVLPCFYWHKNDPDQVSSYYTAAAIGLLLIAWLFVYFNAARKPSPRFVAGRSGVAGVALFFATLLAAGFTGWANHHFMLRDPNRFFEQNILLARVKYPAERFAKPLVRSGYEAAQIHQQISPAVRLEAVLDRWHQASSDAAPEAPRTFMSGPYTFLYPCMNEVRLEYGATAGANGGSPGLFEVTADDGTRVLVQQEIDPAASALSVFPESHGIVKRIEFRAALTNSGSIKINRITYTAQIGRDR